MRVIKVNHPSTDNTLYLKLDIGIDRPIVLNTAKEYFQEDQHLIKMVAVDMSPEEFYSLPEFDG